MPAKLLGRHKTRIENTKAMESDVKQKIELDNSCVDALEEVTAEDVAAFDGCLPLVRVGCYAYKSVHPDKSNSDVIDEVNKTFEEVAKACKDGDIAKYMVGLTDAERDDFDDLSSDGKLIYCVHKTITPEKSHSEIVDELEKTMSPNVLRRRLLMGIPAYKGDVPPEISDTSKLTLWQKIKRFFDASGDFI